VFGHVLDTLQALVFCARVMWYTLVVDPGVSFVLQDRSRGFFFEPVTDCDRGVYFDGGGV
jgi:hypothetical protein